MNKVVARCLDGRVIKGLALDFGPAKDLVHIVDAQDGKKVTEIPTSELKALFFVKSFAGDPSHDTPDFTRESLEGLPGLKIKVTFQDSELMCGTTNGYSPKRPGFFLIPADKNSNNIRVYVYAAATQTVETWTECPPEQSVEERV
jgi:hypothetical protein